MRDLGELRPYEKKVRRAQTPWRAPGGGRQRSAAHPPAQDSRGRRREQGRDTARMLPEPAEGTTVPAPGFPAPRPRAAQEAAPRLRSSDTAASGNQCAAGRRALQHRAARTQAAGHAGGESRAPGCCPVSRQRRPCRSRTAGKSGPLVGLVPLPRRQRPALRLSPSGPGIPTPSCALGRPLRAQPLPAGPGPRRTAFREGAGGRPGASEQS